MDSSPWGHQEMVKDGEAGQAAVHGVAEWDTTEQLTSNNKRRISLISASQWSLLEMQALQAPLQTYRIRNSEHGAGNLL